MPLVNYEEWQLTSLFGVEPKYDSPEDPWPYTSVTWTVTQPPLSLLFSIHPAYGDVSIELDLDSERVYEFSALSLKKVEYRNDPGGESLLLTVSDSDHLALRVEPNILIWHDAPNHP